MKKGTGIQLNNDNDLKISVKKQGTKIVSGRAVGPTASQNQMVLMQARIGELKHAPVTGVGIADMLLDGNTLYWRSKLRQALEREHFKVKRLEFNNTNTIDLDADY